MDASRQKRVEFIPVEWFETVHGDNSDLRDCLDAITLPSVPSIRQIANNVALDVILYLGTNYRQRILHKVAANLNAAYRCARP
jgi:hypothetical protein